MKTFVAEKFKQKEDCTMSQIDLVKKEDKVEKYLKKNWKRDYKGSNREKQVDQAECGIYKAISLASKMFKVYTKIVKGLIGEFIKHKLNERNLE